MRAKVWESFRQKEQFSRWMKTRNTLTFLKNRNWRIWQKLNYKGIDRQEEVRGFANYIRKSGLFIKGVKPKCSETNPNTVVSVLVRG